MLEQDQDPLNRGLKRVRASTGITVLGAPVEYDAFKREGLVAKVSKVRQIIGQLPLLQDPHCEFVLLRNCLSLPKIMFLLRAMDTTDFSDLLEDFDTVIRGALSRILGPPLTDTQWEQAKLPTSMGGLGLRAALDHAPVAHAASLLSAKSLLERMLPQGDGEEEPFRLPEHLLDSISARVGENVDTETLMGLSQKMASLKIDLKNQSILLNHFNGEGCVREIARMASLGLPHAGAWLSVIPSPALGLHLRGPEFVHSVKYRLGLPLYTNPGPCPACHQPADLMGDHALACPRYGDRITRHNQLRDLLYETAASAALGPVREGRFLLPGTAAKPADVLLPRWIDGKDGALDVTHCSQFAWGLTFFKMGTQWGPKFQ